jgi:hypothetical protein
MTIDWVLLFSAFGLGGLTVHFIQQWVEQKRRLQMQQAAVDLRRGTRDRS